MSVLLLKADIFGVVGKSPLMTQSGHHPKRGSLYKTGELTTGCIRHMEITTHQGACSLRQFENNLLGDFMRWLVQVQHESVIGFFKCRELAIKQHPKHEMVRTILQTPGNLFRGSLKVYQVKVAT